jgi:LDH2 family malate/lactate/ureidoglycolate dehydrogenase
VPRIQAAALMQFAVEVFKACGAPAVEAAIVADHLVTANLMGVDSHGVMRISQYVQDISEQAIVPGAPINIRWDTDTTAIVDGAWNFGMVTASRAMEVAIRKAQQHHTACVVTERCGHAGRLGTYTQFAAENGLLAVGVCNSPRHGHFVLPWGGRAGRLGTNPISFAVPTSVGPAIIADFSTSAAPEGKIRLYRDQGKTLPEGWIVDAQGVPSINPSDFYGPPMGSILPFGREIGYRGYALSLLVEILGGALAGHDIAVERPGNGVAFFVIDISAFIPVAQFHALIERMRSYLKSSPPADGFSEVLLPGEPDFRTAESRRLEGIPIDEKTWSEMCRCAESLGIGWHTLLPATDPGE